MVFTFALPMTVIRALPIAAVLAFQLLGTAAATVAPPEAAPPTTTLDSCSWDRPGHNPFMGDVVAAVDRYRDIPPEVRARLKARMAKRDYDDLVSIRRDSITGRAKYGATISDMHFGTHQVCHTVTRAVWAERMQERGLVYCESGQCILVPTVCRNVSRITRAAPASEHAATPEDPEDLLAVAPPGAEWAGPPLFGATPTPLAMDESPSFAAPLDWQDPTSIGPAREYALAGAGLPGLVDGAPGLPSTPGSRSSVTSIPPSGSDSPAPLAPTPPVPEPQTWALMLGGLAVLVAWRRRRDGLTAIAPRGAAALALLAAAGAAQAQYKCTAPSGAVTYQQAACPVTQKQQVFRAGVASPDATLLPAVAGPASAPGKATDEQRNAATIERERRTKEMAQAIANVEADFERLRIVRADLDATRKLAAR